MFIFGYLIKLKKSTLSVSKIYSHLSELTPEPTAHGSGSKFVFLSNDELDSRQTQIAYGSFKPGEICQEHLHPTMEECFFFLKGTGIYIVGDERIELINGTFLRIPAGVRHTLIAMGTEPLEFVYWGVATD